MISALSSRTARPLFAFTSPTRRLATQVPPSTADKPPATTSIEDDERYPLRPHLGIKVNRDHGLWAFFRKSEIEGKVSYRTVEAADIVKDKSGRAWAAAELRRKSFKDLHTLWYVVLRERNLLATQQAEARRLGANEQTLGLWAKAFRCRKTMARIKYVINERRLAYEGALRIHSGKHEKAVQQAELVRATKEIRAAAKVEKEQKRERTPQPSHVDVAARSLFETVPMENKA